MPFFGGAGQYQIIGTNIRGGNEALPSVEGANNIALGNGALQETITGSENIAIGNDAGKNDNLGSNSYNVLIGFDSLKDLSGNAAASVAIGTLSGSYCTSFPENVAIGSNVCGNQAGASSYGDKSIENCTVVGNNAAVKYSASSYNAAATDSIIIGKLSGLFDGTRETIYDCILIGNECASGPNGIVENISNSIVIGSRGNAAKNDILIGNAIEENLGNAIVIGDATHTTITIGGIDFSGGAGPNIELNNTTFADQTGIIYKGGVRFIHNFNYGDNGTVTTNGANTFAGYNSGNFSLGSAATVSYQGSNNTGFGHSTLYSLTTGYNNVAVGTTALAIATTAGNCTAIGNSCLSGCTTGGGNSGLGHAALFTLSTGSNNNAVGNSALLVLSTGSDNTGNGYAALRSLTTGSSNTALGSYAGYNASQKVDAVNSTCIGYQAYNDKSNQVVIGNPSITETVLRGVIRANSTYTVAALLAAATAGVGARSFVTDSTVAAAGNFGNVVAGGGANKVPVWSDGANWLIG